LFLSLIVFGQSKEEIIRIQDSIYRAQVNKTRIDGVYIPKDVNEAMAELDRLSPKESTAKLKTIDEETMAKKLHFGLGRWMVVNWQLGFGSRMSKYLTELGLKGEDEMSQYLLISYHRHLKKTPINEQQLAKEIILKRELEYRKMMKEIHGIDSVVIKKG
jgi:hypothetical protein